MEKDVDIIIGERISALRNAKGIKSQQALKNKLKEAGLDVPRQTVNYWENGQRSLKSEYIIKLAQVLECSCDEILTGEKPEYLQIERETGLKTETIENLKNVKMGLSSYHISNALINDFLSCEWIGEFLYYWNYVMKIALELGKAEKALIQAFDENGIKYTQTRNGLLEAANKYKHIPKLRVEAEQVLHYEDRLSYAEYKFSLAFRLFIESIESEQGVI